MYARRDHDSTIQSGRRDLLMSWSTRISLLILSIAGLISTVSATSYAEQYIGVTCLGPTGVLVDLGFPPGYTYFYNYISLCFLFLIAASASERNNEFFAILLPIFAAMFMWFGWLVGPSTEQLWGIVICCGVLATAVYIKGRQQAKFGISGPGSPFLNLVFWMIVVQASIGFINATDLFNYNAAVTPDGYTNVQLTEDVQNITGTGGFWDTITSDAYLLGAAGFSALMLLWKTLAAVVNFQSLILSIAPWLSGSPLVSTMLVAITIGIDFMIAIAVWTWLFKPPAGENV